MTDKTSPMTVKDALKFVERHGYRKGEPMDPPREALLALADEVERLRQEGCEACQ